MTIEVSDTIEMARIVAQLVREGVTFRVINDPTIKGHWVIELKGGY